jgi:hypothetical protein
MSNVNIFQNGAKTVPKSDSQIVRVIFEKADLAGRPPSSSQAGELGIQHVPNASKSPG